MSDPLAIIYEDEHLICVYKPAKLLVHRSPIDRHETRFLVQLLRDQIGQTVFPIHRLDKPTAGLLLLGKSSQAASLIQAQIQAQTIEKEYLAIVRGTPVQSLFIDHPVKAHKDKYSQKKDDPKPAQTSLSCLSTTRFPIQVDPRYTEARYALVKLSPHTGRRHQLRYHMKHIAHPIIGDSKYGKSLHNRFFETRLEQRRLYLCANALSFIHPFEQQPVKLKVQPDEEFMRAIDFCQFDLNRI